MTFGTISCCPLFCLQSREGEPSFFALALAPRRTGLSEMQGLEEGKNEGHPGGMLGQQQSQMASYPTWNLNTGETVPALEFPLFRLWL